MKLWAIWRGHNRTEQSRAVVKAVNIISFTARKQEIMDATSNDSKGTWKEVWSEDLNRITKKSIKFVWHWPNVGNSKYRMTGFKREFNGMVTYDNLQTNLFCLALFPWLLIGKALYNRLAFSQVTELLRSWASDVFMRKEHTRSWFAGRAWKSRNTGCI